MTSPLDDSQRQCLERFQTLQFVQKRFAVYPSLRERISRPDDDDVEWRKSIPYLGQPYDPEEYELVEDDWDHEHCWICSVSIEVGDLYWASVEPEGYELCLDCYSLHLKR